VQLNSPFDVKVKVTNLTNMMVSDVVVTDWLADNFKFSKATGTTKLDGNTLVWQAGSLGRTSQRKWSFPEQLQQQLMSRLCNRDVCDAGLCKDGGNGGEAEHYQTAPAEGLICDTIPSNS